METDVLKTETEKVVKLCKDHDILLFYGTMENTSDNILDAKASDDNLDVFLEAITYLKPKVVFIEIINYNLNQSDEEIEQCLNHYKKSGNKEWEEEFKASAKVVKQHIGKMVSYDISFLHDTIHFKFEREAAWYDDYYTFRNYFDEFTNLNSE